MEREEIKQVVIELIHEARHRLHKVLRGPVPIALEEAERLLLQELGEFFFYTTGLDVHGASIYIFLNKRNPIAHALRPCPFRILRADEEVLLDMHLDFGIVHAVPSHILQGCFLGHFIAEESLLVNQFNHYLFDFFSFHTSNLQ